MNPTTTTPEPVERRTATIVMACLGVFVAYLPVTAVAVSLPALQTALGASTAQLSWVQDAFVLPMAAFILTAGVFGDVHGRKRVFQAGLVLSGAGAGVALCAPSIEVVWAGQGVAGLGAAALLPTTLALISHVVPDHRERGTFIGVWAASLTAALAIGPLIAGSVVAHFSWRWIYLPSVPVALATATVAARQLSDSRAPYGRRLDWPGQLTAALSISALVYGVIEGGASSFTDVKVLVALVTAVAAGAGFVLAELRSASPMLDLTLFRSSAFTATTLVAMVSFLALIGCFFVLSLYFGMVQRVDALEAGWRLLEVTGVSLFVAWPAGRLMHRTSARWMITVGLVLAAAAQFALAGLDAHTSFASTGWRLALLGLGMGFVMTPMTATAVAAVPHHLAGMAAAGNNAFRQVGGALGPAVLGALLTKRAVAVLPGHLADAGVTGSARDSVVAAARTGGLDAVAELDLGAQGSQVTATLSGSFLDGLRLCLVTAGSLTLLAALVAVTLLRAPGDRLARRAAGNAAADRKVTVTSSA